MKSFFSLTLLAVALSAQEAPKKSINQSATGANSQNIANVKGNVNIATNIEPPNTSQPVVKPITETDWFRYETMVRRMQDAQTALDDAKKEAESAYQQICKTAGAKTTDLCQPQQPNPKAPDYADYKFGKVTIIAEQPKVDAKPEPAKVK